jgi:hypothetical protein
VQVVPQALGLAHVRKSMHAPGWTWGARQFPEPSQCPLDSVPALHTEHAALLG